MFRRSSRQFSSAGISRRNVKGSSPGLRVSVSPTLKIPLLVENTKPRSSKESLSASKRPNSTLAGSRCGGKTVHSMELTNASVGTSPLRPSSCTSLVPSSQLMVGAPAGCYFDWRAKCSDQRNTVSELPGPVLTSIHKSTVWTVPGEAGLNLKSAVVSRAATMLTSPRRQHRSRQADHRDCGPHRCFR